eukprot:6182111-Pleurochrysis_carterae.AAC.2
MDCLLLIYSIQQEFNMICAPGTLKGKAAAILRKLSGATCGTNRRSSGQTISYSAFVSMNKARFTPAGFCRRSTLAWPRSPLGARHRRGSACHGQVLEIDAALPFQGDVERGMGSTFGQSSLQCWSKVQRT